jgi:hypothetical protein
MSSSCEANGSREGAPDDRLREAIDLSLRCEMDCFEQQQLSRIEQVLHSVVGPAAYIQGCRRPANSG